MTELTKARFERLDNNFRPVGGSGTLEVDFNPTEYTLNKRVQIADIAIPGLDTPIQQFVRGQTEILNVDLFFDTTDEGTDERPRPVTEKTDQFYQLIKIDPETHAPPVCRFSWGGVDFPGSNFDEPWESQNRGDGFQCIVESVQQRFNLFSPAGVPLRATLTLSLREYRTLEQQIEEISFQSSDHTSTHVVQRGETLAQIANELYDDPGRWREIADHNRINDPLDLRPGMILQIPPLS